MVKSSTRPAIARILSIEILELPRLPGWIGENQADRGRKHHLAIRQHLAKIEYEILRPRVFERQLKLHIRGRSTITIDSRNPDPEATAGFPPSLASHKRRFARRELKETECGDGRDQSDQLHEYLLKSLSG